MSIKTDRKNVYTAGTGLILLGGAVIITLLSIGLIFERGYLYLISGVLGLLIGYLEVWWYYPFLSRNYKEFSLRGNPKELPRVFSYMFFIMLPYSMVIVALFTVGKPYELHIYNSFLMSLAVQCIVFGYQIMRKI